ncbi:MAG: thioredoxin fold domain-containing protein [Gammaproteobacteria bacterium]|jgi:thiol:disulfide interchange protein DsbC|nr:thioredoxin fold domain-containing protein [Gammaproteobacteria bacterium]
MRSVIGSLLLAAALTAGLAPAARGEVDEDLVSVRAQITERFPQLEPESINEGPIPGFYEIRQGVLVAYVTTDGRYLFQGDLIDLENGTNLTDAAMNGERKRLMDSLPDEDAIVFAPAEPTHTVTIFTDIDCGFCRKLHREIDDYNDAGIAVRYLLYPRSGPGQASWQKSESVWCAEDQNTALTRAKNGQPVQSRACDAAMVQRHYDLGRDVGLRGTPAIVTETGELVSGYLPPAQLLERLEASATE